MGDDLRFRNFASHRKRIFRQTGLLKGVCPETIEQIVAVLKQAELEIPVAGSYSAGWHSGTDVLPLEEAVWRTAIRSGARTLATTG